MLATEPPLSVCKYACAALLRVELDATASEALQGIIAALRDYGANLNDLGEYETWPSRSAAALCVRSRVRSAHD
jgi:hypothetical protein